MLATNWSLPSDLINVLDTLKAAANSSRVQLGIQRYQSLTLIYQADLRADGDTEATNYFRTQIKRHGIATKASSPLLIGLIRCYVRDSADLANRWSMALRLAKRKKVAAKELEDFIKRNGGLEKCVTRFRELKAGDRARERNQGPHRNASTRAPVPKSDRKQSPVLTPSFLRQLSDIKVRGSLFLTVEAIRDAGGALIFERIDSTTSSFLGLLERLKRQRPRAKLRAPKGK